MSAFDGIALRPARAQDADAIEVLTLVAYFDVPGSTHREHQVVDALRADGALSLSWVAEHDGYVVAHLAASPVELSDGGRGWHALGPLAVGPGHRGQGLASDLLRAAMAQLQQDGAAGCVVASPPRALFLAAGFAPEPGLTLAGAPLLAHAFGDRLPPLAEVSLHPALSGEG
ncbi:MAG TPA: N-acetyltransferase [Stenotrophomonas sp.]|nr:N-acetyltransferase [Stenotrophomonas sp.]